MLKENEVIMLLLGLGVLALILLNIHHVRKIRYWKTICISYCLILSGWIFTVLEGIFWESFLNYLEHLCYLASAILMSIWCIKATVRIKMEDRQ